MDNLFEILIYLFIIYAFLSSLFRKKKQTQKPPQPQQGEREIHTASVNTEKDKEYDILKEIEGFFNIPEQKTKKEEQTEVAPDYFKSTEWHSDVQPEQKSTPIQQKTESWEEKRKRIELSNRKKVDDKILRQAALFEKRLTTKDSYAVDVKRIISSRFKDAASLKEYMVISEILGKPKAFAGEYFGQE